MKTVMTITGIRPDFIRMRGVFRRLDESPYINHILVHSGQHYDTMLSDVFFTELEIRKPDYNLGCGAPGKEHFELSGDITKAVIQLIRSEGLNPDLILFLGDTNSVVCTVGLKKEGYFLGHIEAGMRSYDRRMLEEINRTVCDHCCDLHFVYHPDYATHLLKESICPNGIHVVGNTIVEVCRPFARDLAKLPSRKDQIIMDIHRPENFKDPVRLRKIVEYAQTASRMYNVPVHMVSFGRTMQKLDEFGIDLGSVEAVPLMSYKQFLDAQYNSLFVYSDSGTAQEEVALLGRPVVVPRDFTERPQSMEYNCSYLMHVENDASVSRSFEWLADQFLGSCVPNPVWLGSGNTAERIVKIIEGIL